MLLQHPLHRGRRQAAACVELAVMAPFLCFAMLACTDYARIFYYAITIDNCARNGAVYGSADQSHALDSSGIQSAAQLDAGNLSLQQMTVTSSTDSSTSPTYVTVTVSYPFSTITTCPGIPSQVTLQRSVRMSVVPATPSF